MRSLQDQATRARGWSEGEYGWKLRFSYIALNRSYKHQPFPETKGCWAWWHACQRSSSLSPSTLTLQQDAHRDDRASQLHRAKGQRSDGKVKGKALDSRKDYCAFCSVLVYYLNVMQPAFSWNKDVFTKFRPQWSMIATEMDQGKEREKLAR